MRYSVRHASTDQLKAVGALNIRAPHNIPVIFAELTDSQVAQLKSIGSIITNIGKVNTGIIHAPIAPPMPIAGTPTYTPAQVLSLIGLEELRNFFTPAIYGEGFNIAIIDTGIRETHELIHGQVIYRKNYTTDPMQDGFDHGTGVCSLALAAAPKAGILNLKVLGDNGEGTEEEVTLAIDDCIDLQETNPDLAPIVINLSLGAADDGNPDTPLRAICRAAIDHGMYVGAAVGNGGPETGTIASPACEQWVFACGSIKYLADQESYTVSEFSSRGPTKEGHIKPDCCMFGENIIMASSESDTATVAKSGTSFSTPILSGFGLMYQEAMSKYGVIEHEFPGIQPGITVAVPQASLIENHLPGICLRPQEAKDNNVGYGVPFGPLVASHLVPVGIDIMGLLMPMVVIMMMGLMIKTVGKK